MQIQDVGTCFSKTLNKVLFRGLMCFTIPIEIVPGCGLRDSSSNPSVLTLHRPHPHLLQVSNNDFFSGFTKNVLVFSCLFLMFHT